ncbi:DUF6207 family protein [Streptomyces sp. NPDC001292]|uniref:DUF6207 family protein n=1 Tax=Streptomyces sp. NPDC001292 TaxID=3364558 RepID=UPI00367D98CF
MEIATCDDQTALRRPGAACHAVGDRDGGPYDRDPGQPGVRLRCYLDVRQTLGP